MSISPATSYRSSVVSGRVGGSCCSLNSMSSSSRSEVGIDACTSIRTTSAKRRFRTSSWIRLSRSSASSPLSICRSVFRVMRKVYQPRISTPGKSASRLAPITSSRGTNVIRRRERHPARQDLGHLDPGEALLAVRTAQHHGEREAQVGDVRERVARVDGERGEDRKDVRAEVGVERARGRPARARPGSGAASAPARERGQDARPSGSADAAVTSSRTTREMARSWSSGVMPSAVRSTIPAATAA